MSRSLFNGVPAGAIEVISNAEGLLQFKRADLGRFLGLVDIRAAYRDVKTTSRKLLIPHASDACLPKDKNDQDAFIDLDGALEIVVRSKKPKAVELVKWLTRKGVEKLVEDHQKTIEEKQKTIDEKDMHIALLSDDFLLEQKHARQLEFNNVGLQGEIRAMDQELHRKMKEVQDLIQNRYVPRKYPIDNVLCFVNKNSDERHQFYVIRCQRKSLETHKRCLRNRYPNMVVLGECEDANAVHRWCRFKKNVIDDFHRNHFNLNEEARELMETAFDIEV